jgi:hypothetical protein
VVAFTRCFLASLKPFLVAGVCDQNKKYFENSVAYREIMKLPDGFVKETLLEKYDCSESVHSENIDFLGSQSLCSFQ